MQIVSVRMVNAETPILIVKYKHTTVQDVTDGIQWLSHLNLIDVAQIKSSVMEQNLLLRLLHYNSQMVRVNTLNSSPHFESSYDQSAPITNAEDRANFRWSFILPVGAIERDLRDGMDADAKKECAVCGVPCTELCSGCRSVFYCGAGERASHLTSPVSLRRQKTPFTDRNHTIEQNMRSKTGRYISLTASHSRTWPGSLCLSQDPTRTILIS